MLIAMGIPGSDFIVSGTNGDDAIDVAYTGDPDGDMVDGNDNLAENNDDVILAGGGSDRVVAGAGDDLIYGDTGDNLIAQGSFEGTSPTTFGQVGTLENWYSWSGNGSPDLNEEGGYEASYASEAAPTDGQNYIAMVNNGSNFKEGISQDLSTPLIAGKTYTITLDAAAGGYYNNSPLGDDLLLQIYGSETAGQVAEIYGDAPTGLNLLGSVAVTTDYTTGTMGTVSITFTPTTDIATLSISLEDSDFESTFAVLTIDNVQLIETPPGISSADTLFGGDGNDTIYGEIGDDSLDGGNGNDLLDGGEGADTIVGGAGNDSIDGGDDQDEIVLKNGFGEDTINGGEGGTDYDILDAGDVTSNLIVDLSANGANDPESGTISYEGAPAGFHYIRVFEPNDPSIIDSRGVYPRGDIDFNDGVFHMLLVEDNDTMLGDTQGGSRIVDHTQAAARDLGGLDISGFNVGSPGKSTFVDANGDSFEVGWLQSYGSGGTTTVPNGTFLIVTDTSAGGAPVGTSTSTGYENAIADFRYSSFTGGQTTSEFTEIEEVILGSGDDVVIGSSGGDKVLTGAGADTVYGGAGDDEIYGDAGDDVVEGGTGNDTISGGDGDDTFVYSAGDGADTITDFGTDDSDSINDGDNSNNDFVDLSGFYNTTTLAAVNGSDSDPSNDIKTALHMLRADAADGAIDGIIDGVDHSASIGDIDLTLLSAGSAVVGDDLTFDNTGVPCFVSGTLITTARGLVPVEELQAGDRVQTRDNGFRKIVWVGSKKATATGKLAPIRIEKGLLQNDRALWLSPNHRILHVNWQAELMFGETEVLHSAKTLLGTSGVRQVEGGSVAYFHILFEQHEIIRSEGTWTESFHPGQVGLGALSNETRDEILELFPELQSTTASYGGTARVSLHTYEAKLLLAA